MNGWRIQKSPIPTIKIKVADMTGEQNPGFNLYIIKNYDKT